MRTWPFCSWCRNSERTSDWVCSSQARRDRTTLLRCLSSSMIFFQLFDSAPCAFVLCALLGEDQSAFFVFFGEDEGVDLVAHFDDFVWVDVVFDGELAYGDDAFGLVSDVEQDLVVIDFHHGAFNDVAVVEVFDGGVDGCEEFLRAANVVNGNLGGFIGGHMLGAPNCV